MGYANYRGKSFCIAVHYFTVAFPIYIGAILRRDTQNYSYIYRNISLISVKVYITIFKPKNFIPKNFIQSPINCISKFYFCTVEVSTVAS